MFDGLLQPWHLLIILVIVLIIFGPGKLPDLGSALGRSIKEFRGGIREIQDDLDINGGEAEQEQKAAATTAEVTAPKTTPLAAATTPIASPNSAATSTQTAAPAATQVVAPPQSATATQEHAHTCSICGTVAAPGARFCANCGNPING